MLQCVTDQATYNIPVSWWPEEVLERWAKGVTRWFFANRGWTYFCRANSKWGDLPPDWLQGFLKGLFSCARLCRCLGFPFATKVNQISLESLHKQCQEKQEYSANAMLEEVLHGHSNVNLALFGVGRKLDFGSIIRWTSFRSRCLA